MTLGTYQLSLSIDHSQIGLVQNEFITKWNELS